MPLIGSRSDAALNTVEPPILELGTARLLEGDKPWHAERLPLVEDRVRGRLHQLSVRLGDADWLDGAFSAGDLLMVSVLLRLKVMVMVIERLLLGEHPRLRRQTFATMAERLPWNVSATPPALLHHPARRALDIGRVDERNWEP